MRRYCFIIALFIATMVALPTHAEDADDILGLWATSVTEQGYSHVKIERNGDRFSGTIVWLSKPFYEEGDPDGEPGQPKRDANNPDTERQNDPIIGLAIAKNFSYSGKGRWESGTIYDPENGKTYKCKMAIDGETLKVRGFIGFSLLGRTTVWSRTKDPS